MKRIFLNISRTLSKIFKNPEIKYSFLTILLVILIATVLLAINYKGSTYNYGIDDIAKEEIRVPKDIRYVNEEETELKRKQVAESSPLVFDKDASVLADNLVMVSALFNHIEATIKSFPPIGVDDVPFYLMVVKSKLPPYQQYTDALLTELIASGKPVELKRVATQSLINFYSNYGSGIVEKSYDNPLNIKNKNVLIRTINSATKEEDSEITGSLEELKTVDEVRNTITRTVFSYSPNLTQKTAHALISVLNWHLRPNTRFNPDETKKRIELNVKSMKPAMSVLKRGFTIVREGDKINADIKFNIDIFNKHSRSINFGYVFGIFLIQLVFISIFGFFLLGYSTILIPDKKSTMILFTLILFFMLYAFFLSQSETIMGSRLTFVLLLPIPFVTMIISILYNMFLAIFVGVFSVFFTAILGGGDLSVIVVSFSSALLGVFINANVNRRTDFLRGGFVLGFINTIVLLAITLVQGLPISRATSVIHYSFANGIINSILVLGILPLYENVFGITTKFKLLELSDLNADIFKQMLVEAPGTYNHSLIVSTMAETACKDINANYMLARVGAFYHDIGKIDDAGIYIENKVTDARATVMNPLEYSKLIISHVEKGIHLAERHMLPESIINFIREHHGQTTMTYFYHQALEEADTSDQGVGIDKKDFQYPGPKPGNKEIAIVMLADSIEAASRSLHEPTREKLEGLVRKIVYNKLNDGELDYSDLSMTELSTIQNSFLRILFGIFHTRIEYPDSQDVKKLEKKVMQNGKN